jgi:hypothetical protein
MYPVIGTGRWIEEPSPDFSSLAFVSSVVSENGLTLFRVGERKRFHRERNPG